MFHLPEIPTESPSVHDVSRRYSTTLRNIVVKDAASSTFHDATFHDATSARRRDAPFVLGDDAEEAAEGLRSEHDAVVAAAVILRHPFNGPLDLLQYPGLSVRSQVLAGLFVSGFAMTVHCAVLKVFQNSSTKGPITTGFLTGPAVVAFWLPVVPEVQGVFNLQFGSLSSVFSSKLPTRLRSVQPSCFLYV